MNTKTIDGFSLALSLITIGFFSLYFEPFNDVFGMNISYYVGMFLIIVGTIGLLVEISNFINKDRGGSDLSASIFISIIIYISWKILDYLNWLNNITITILMILGLFLVYGLYRGTALVFSYLVSNFQKKKN